MMKALFLIKEKCSIITNEIFGCACFDKTGLAFRQLELLAP